MVGKGLRFQIDITSLRLMRANAMYVIVAEEYAAAARAHKSSRTSGGPKWCVGDLE